MTKDIETPFFESVKEIWRMGFRVMEFEYRKTVLKHDLSKLPEWYLPKWKVRSHKAFATDLDLLFNEVKANLDECKGLDLENYIFSLMLPFKGLADVLHNDNLRRMWDYGIKKWKPLNEWVFNEIKKAKPIEPPTNDAPKEDENNWCYSLCVYTMSELYGLFYVYANMLDAILLEKGLDLLRIQKQVGITMLMRRDLTQIEHYMGTPEMAKMLIGRIEPEQPEPQPEGAGLPDVLNTDEAKGLLDRLCKAGFAKIEDGGYKWIGTKVLCAYFADRASHSLNLSNTMDKEGNITTSWKPFEALFEIKGLKDAKQNWMRLNTKFEPTGFEAIAKLFEPEG